MSAEVTGIRGKILDVSNALMFLLALLLVALISYDTLRNISFMTSEFYLKAQFWICSFFMFDVLLEVILSPRRTARFNLSRAFFLILSIPYINILSFLDITVSGEAVYILRIIPLLRVAFAIALVGGTISGNWITNLFTTYIILLVMLVYAGSLMFFVEEHYVNPGVPTYGDALWWTIMDLTTCGCNINPITPWGKALGVVLSAAGLILFPVFTVYLTNALGSKNNKGS